MKSLVCVRPGLFEYRQSATPVLQPGHAILKIKRVGICGTDLHAYRGTQPYFSYPRILGHELAADLLDADHADGFVPGEALTFIPYISCKKCIACRNGKPNCCIQVQVCGVHIDGGMSEYFSVPADLLVKSRGLNYDQLALVEPMAIGAHAIRRAQVLQGEFVLVSGAGPIGLATMEFARIAGAHVIAIDVQESRLQFCRDRLGIPFTIHAGNEDVLLRLEEITQGDMPAVVIDATGSRQAINHAFRYLAHGGRYILVGLQREDIIFSHPEFHKREATLMSSRNATREDFEFVVKCISDRVIDPAEYITHRVGFSGIRDEFESWLDPSSGLIKAIAEFD